MASPPGQSPYTVTETKTEDPIAKAKWAYLTKGANAPLNIWSADVSRKAQILAGVGRNDPKAIKELFGHTPTAQDWARIKGGPATFNISGKGNTQTAAQGGLMTLRGYAPGGTTEATTQKAMPQWMQDAVNQNNASKANLQNAPQWMQDAAKAEEARQATPTAPATQVGNKGLDDEQAAFVKQMSKLAADGKELTQAQKDRLNRIEQKTGRDVSPYTNVGTIAPSNPTIAKAAEQIQSSYAAANPPADSTGAQPGSSTQPGSPAPGVSLAGGLTAPPVGFNPNLLTATPEEMAKDPYAGVTNPFYQKAIDQMNTMKMPDEYGQASNMYRTAGAGLQGAAGYTPEQVAYNNATAERASAQQASAAQMGQIANVNAERAAAERAATAQMGSIADIAAQRAQTRGYDAALMNAPERVAASDYEAAQMQKAGDVSTKDLTAYQMEGPGAWIDEGMAQQYMNPYIQGVVDISKREAERDYLKQQNALNAKAMSAGAFGGARQALERSEAQRNYNDQLQDIQTRGLSEAYTQGRSQYSTDTAAQQAARIQNLQSQLSTQSQSAQQTLQAALANQSVEMQTAQQNMAALNAQKQNFVNQQLQAAINNYGGELTAEQANQVAQNAAAQFYSTAENQAAMQYATQALQAAQANQQTQFGVGSLNANLSQQANLQNAQLGTQTNLANQQAALQAALANQQTQFGVGSLNANLANQTNLQNANLGTQAAMQNAQLGTQTNLANSQYGLNAAMANQQAGLQGNQQNIAAYGAMGNMATGLGSIGTNIANYNQQQLGNWGAMGNTYQSGMTEAANQAQKNEWNVQNPGAIVSPFASTIMPSGGGSNTTGTTYTA